MTMSEKIRQENEAYGRPDGATRGYAGALAVFAATTALLTAGARALGRRPPDLTPWDLAVLGLTTHKLSRILAKDAVTSPLRAPFVRFEGSAGDAELAEEVRGSGGRKALGELLTCPFCLGPWIATGLVAGLTFAPTLTRAATATMSAVAVSDFLQLGYAAGQQRTTPPEQRGG
jgi:hypothetical protein